MNKRIWTGLFIGTAVMIILGYGINLIRDANSSILLHIINGVAFFIFMFFLLLFTETDAIRNKYF